MTNTTNTRKQLFTAVAMLLVAALALGTATYAWFVNNTQTEVGTMNFAASSSEAVEIALSTTAWDGTITGTGATAGAFKSMITTKDIEDLYNGFTGHTTTWGALLAPASTIDVTNFYKEALWDDIGAIVTTHSAVNNANDNAVKVIPLYLKSSKDMSIYLDSNKTKITNPSGGAIAAARIGFKVGSQTTLWQYDNTTQVPNRRATSKADGVLTAVSGVGSTATLTANKVITNVTSVGAIVSGGGIATSENVIPDKNATPLVQLKAEIPQLVLVYVWLEGCDYDCVTGISQEQFAVDLKFLGTTK